MGGAGGGSIDGDIMNGAMTNGGGSALYSAVLYSAQPTADVTSDGIANLDDCCVADHVEELNAGNLYVNIHTTNFPPGETRGHMLTVE